MKVPVSNVVQMPQAQGPKIDPTMLAMAAHMMVQEGKLVHPVSGVQLDYAGRSPMLDDETRSQELRDRENPLKPSARDLKAQEQEMERRQKLIGGYGDTAPRVPTPWQDI